MLKSVAYANVFDRFFGPKMTKWAHVDLRQEKQWFGRCFFGQKLIIGSENWDWGGGPKRYVFHSKSTCGHFCHFWSKKHSIFRYVLHYFSTWCRLVTFCPKSDAPDLCFPVSNRLCQKWKFPIFAKSIWDRKRLLNLMIFRTKSHKIPTSAKVVCSLSFFTCFGG